MFNVQYSVQSSVTPADREGQAGVQGDLPRDTWLQQGNLGGEIMTQMIT